jgi:hypothetical protein
MRRRNIYGPSDELWREAKSAAAADGKTLSHWIEEAIMEKLLQERGPGSTGTPYIIVRRNGEVMERIPFDCDNLAVAAPEICEKVRKRGYPCIASEIEVLPPEREAQGPDTPERAIIELEEMEDPENQEDE